jgi:type II restriction enzyme
MPGELAERYNSPSQKVRVVSEAWGAENLYCASCPSDRIVPLPNNSKAVDFDCPRCRSRYQLKSQRRPLASQIMDAGYKAMREAIVQNRTPNVLALHYDFAGWGVQSLILIPRFVFSLSCIVKRNPLSPLAERHGHVLCNIALSNIPPDAQIPVIRDGVALNPNDVRDQYARLRPLENVGHEARGWTLDVLNVVRSLGKNEFSLAEVYARAEALARLHPQNKHIGPKIRQQLQRLRDLGLVEFQGRGIYRAT